MRVVRLVFTIFAIVGLGLMIGSVIAVWHTRQFLATAVSVPGVVTGSVLSGRGSYFPRIRFRTSDGQQISIVTNTGSNPPQYDVNQRVTVLYDPRQPDHAYIQSFAELWLLPTILGGIGLIFCSFGAVAGILKAVRAGKNSWLRQNGNRILAEVTGVEPNAMVTVNGMHPYRIVCQWRDPFNGQLYIFHSANIWFDPGRYIQRTTVEVLVDPNRPRRYEVDTSFLPKAV